MSKWKCEICGSEFDNFYAQGFDNKIYCPLCFFKKENKQLKEEIEKERKARLDDYKFTPEELVGLLNHSLVERVKEQDKQLKQRDEVIDEANKLIIDYLCSEEYCSLNVPLIADLFMKLQQTLQKYKGDNNE